MTLQTINTGDGLALFHRRMFDDKYTSYIRCDLGAPGVYQGFWMRI